MRTCREVNSDCVAVVLRIQGLLSFVSGRKWCVSTKTEVGISKQVSWAGESIALLACCSRRAAGLLRSALALTCCSRVAGWRNNPPSP